MKKQIIEHISSIIFITVIFAVLIVLVGTKKENNSVQNNSQLPEKYKIENIDYENQLHKALLKETLQIFYKQQVADSLFHLYDFEFNNNLSESARIQNEINLPSILRILLMYIKFMFVYAIVLGLTYYGVQTIAVYRFITNKQNNPPLLILALYKLQNIKKGLPFKKSIEYIMQSFIYILKALVKVILYFVLFSPAYVIAYSFKTKFDTDSFIFIIILGVISNALLITYAQKFYTFLITESNKGYVETAIVKNLANDYSFNSIQISSILNLKKIFQNHVFNHIFINAQHQYYATIKEQAAFLITGLIIIEMALNIHGHLSYELMQNLLYQKYQLVFIIRFLIYITVKATEIFVDVFIYKQNRKFENNLK